MKQTLLVLITIISFNCYSQIKFEKGYFINNDGERTDCLIKNSDWRNNPMKFQYRLTEDSISKIATIESVKEFGINSFSKYKRFYVKIDRSKAQANNLDYERNPKFIEDTLFLKSLIEGSANLYLYEDEDGILIRYFYSVDNSNVEQLVYKKYLKDDNVIGHNNRYKQQLWIDLKCEHLTIKDAENTGYRKDDLIKYFVKYNNCVNSDIVNYEEKHKRDLFNLNIRPGLTRSSLSIDESWYNLRDTDFGNKINFRLGIEAEFILPFNKNKWTIIIEPTYQYFKAEKELIYYQTASIDYKSIELPFGLRHYFFLNNKSKIFINVAYLMDFDLNSKIEFTKTSDLEIKTRNNIIIGIGYNHQNKYSLEIRYGLKRSVLGDYITWSSEYTSFSIILGYSLF